MPTNQRVVPGAAADLDPLMVRLRRGSDPTLCRAEDGWWRTSRTPEGPVLLHLARADQDVAAAAWGAGADWALDQLPRLLGRADDPAPFQTWLRAEHPEWLAVQGANPIRLGATDRLAESLAPVVIEQLVTGAEAFFSIRQLVHQFGEPAPGPELPTGHRARGLRIPPSAEQWAQIPSWEFTRAGVDRSRTQAVVRACSRIDALQRLLDGAPTEVTARGEALQAGLCAIPGIGPWTAAKVRQQVLGDPDAWSIDDYHVPGHVARLLGGAQATADQAEALLEDCRPHRYRVELVAGRSPLATQRRGPRRSLPTHLPTRFTRGRR